MIDTREDEVGTPINQFLESNLHAVARRACAAVDLQTIFFMDFPDADRFTAGDREGSTRTCPIGSHNEYVAVIANHLYEVVDSFGIIAVVVRYEDKWAGHYVSF
jgi:hypothetical protein